MVRKETRLNKILADAGIASRRNAEKLIAEGRVKVNGNIVSSPGAKADRDLDEICFEGAPIKFDDGFIYIMLHKPEGFVTTANDPQGRPVAADLLPRGLRRVFSVGRLDYDSSGLLIFTNDGVLANALTHPGAEVQKIYSVKIRGLMDAGSIKKFKSGLLIEGKKTAPCGLKIIRVYTEPFDSCLARVTLREGRNRQIRKMFEALGHRVVSLKRVQIGKLKLGELPRGCWRYINEKELSELLIYKGAVK